MNKPIIAIENLQRKLDKITVIKHITAEINRGDVIALLGKNGAGKTTLIETILGFSYPNFGSVDIFGKAATEMDGDLKQRIGFVPQQSELISTLNGHKHLALFKSFRTHWNQVLVDKLVVEWLIPLDLAVGKMSVGQQQKLSIVLAMAHEPELLILDEPVASLDPIARRQFLQQLIEIATDENKAIIFSTHIVSDVERVANKIWMMLDGELVYQDDLDSLKESVVRTVLPKEKQIPSDLEVHLINKRQQGGYVQYTFKNWLSEYQARIESVANEKIVLENLSLEEIFLEINA